MIQVDAQSCVRHALHDLDPAFAAFSRTPALAGLVVGVPSLRNSSRTALTNWVNCGSSALIPSPPGRASNWRTGGGFEIFTTKSGTNQYHGSAFEYFRNKSLNSKGHFERFNVFGTMNAYWNYDDFTSGKNMVEDHASAMMQLTLRGGWNIGLTGSIA